jgi:hypothetical protein
LKFYFFKNINLNYSSRKYNRYVICLFFRQSAINIFRAYLFGKRHVKGFLSYYINYVFNGIFFPLRRYVLSIMRLGHSLFSISFNLKDLNLYLNKTSSRSVSKLHEDF